MLNKYKRIRFMHLMTLCLNRADDRFHQFIERESRKIIVVIDFGKYGTNILGGVFCAGQQLFDFGQVGVVAEKSAVKPDFPDYRVLDICKNLDFPRLESRMPFDTELRGATVVPLPGAEFGSAQLLDRIQLLWGELIFCHFGKFCFHVFQQFSGKLVNRNFLGKVGQDIVNQASNRFHTTTFHDVFRRFQRFREYRQIGVEQQAAVVHHASLDISLSIARNFLAVDHQIVATGELRLHAQVRQGVNHGLRERLEVKISTFVLVGYDGVVEVVVVVIDRSPTRYAAHHVDSVLFHEIGIYFLDRVLVFAHDDRRFVDPEDEHLVVMQQVFEAIFLERDVVIRLPRIVDDVYHFY